MTGYKDFAAWQKSKVLTTAILKLNPSKRAVGLDVLLKQICRSALSIPSNIAEGYRKQTVAAKRNGYRIAFGSAAELETQLEILFDLKIFPDDHITPIMKLLDEVLRLLNVMIRSPL